MFHPLQIPHTEQWHTQPSCSKSTQATLSLLERLASLHPGAWSRWQVGRRGDPRKPHTISMFCGAGTAGSFLLQKLCIIWAQEQGHEKMRPSAVQDCFHGGLNSSPYTSNSHRPDGAHSQEFATVWFLRLWLNTQNLHHCSWIIYKAKCFLR